MGRHGALLVAAALTSATAAASPLDVAFPRTDAFDFEAPAAGTYALPVIRPAADGTVLDEQGRRVTLHDAMDGKLVLLSFIYTRCADPDGCPLATAVLYDILFFSEQDRAIADNLRLVSLSFDPGHDTPEIMAGFRGAEPKTPVHRCDWAYLTTPSEAALRPLLDGYDQVVRKRYDDAGRFRGMFAHQLRVYLIDRHKRVRNIYGLGFLDPRLLIADVRTLLMEEQRQGRR